MSVIALFRFDEATAALPTSDETGNVLDLVDAGTSATFVYDGYTGYVRRFTRFGGFDTRMQGKDTATGSSLATRDVTVDAILKWDFDGQVAYNTISGTTSALVMMRGIGPGAAGSSENMAYALELRVVNASLRIGEVRMSWHTQAGVYVAAPGGQFQVPVSTDNGFVIITATRHWVSATQVQLQYYLGDVLLADHTITDGDIGGGASGTFNVGGIAGVISNASSFIGDLDELRVRDEAVSPEEVAATYARIAVWQPRGYTMVKQLQPPGAPVSDDGTSRVQRFFRGMGNAFGYAMAQVDNLSNIMPDRAFGPVLQRWERITRKPVRPGDSIAQRRKRVLSRTAQRQGSSPPGMAATVADLLDIGRDQIQILAASNDVIDTFQSQPSPSRWWFPLPLGSGGPGIWYSNPNKELRITASSTNYPAKFLTDNSMPCGLVAVQGGGKRARALALIGEVTTMGANTEFGVCFVDWTTNQMILYGMRNRAGIRYLSCEWRVNGVTQNLVEIASPVAPGSGVLYLYLHHTSTPGVYRYDYAPAPLAGTTFVSNTFPATTMTRFDWAGVYGRTLAGAGTFDARCNEFRVRSSYGNRYAQWYVYRDPAMPGSPDWGAARSAASDLAQAHTRVSVISNKTAVCDAGVDGSSTASLCDVTPMGAI